MADLGWKCLQGDEGQQELPKVYLLLEKVSLPLEAEVPT